MKKRLGKKRLDLSLVSTAAGRSGCAAAAPTEASAAQVRVAVRSATLDVARDSTVRT